MLDVKSTLEACLKKLSKEYDIEEVNKIPRLEHLPQALTWKVLIPASVLGKVEDIETFVQFPNDFPYSMPYVIIPDDRFRYLPHISVNSRKLCLYEDGMTYDVENIEGLIRDNIVRTRRWVENYFGRDNHDEYAEEIRNYWGEQYDDETIVDDSWILLGNMPIETREMAGITYTYKNLKNGNTNLKSVVTVNEEDETLECIKRLYKTHDIPVLYIASFKIPNEPPFSLTGQQVIDNIENEEDKLKFKKFLNRNKRVYLLFPIGLNYILGGVYIHNLKVNRKGFRKGALDPFKVLASFENKNKKLDRLLILVYSNRRIAERTAGEIMKEKHFLIAGLGSIGSNLCYYLNGYNNATFSLTDRDWLTVDNIGRHLLGFEYIDQYKSNAVAHYLQQYRPDRKMNVMQKNLQQLNEKEINKCNTIFVCTGDIMSEKWLLHKMEECSIRKPAFVLWLEPYGISGIMIYINPEDRESVKTLKAKANDCFMDFCLIKQEEYVSGEKITHRDAGCNGSYALYSANDVTMFLSVMFPIINKLLEHPSKSKCYRWVGNIDIAAEKDINLVSSSISSKNTLQELPI